MIKQDMLWAVETIKVGRKISIETLTESRKL